MAEAKRRPGPHGPGGGQRHGYQKPKDMKGTVKKLLKYMGRYKGALVLVALCLLVSSGGSILSSYLLKPIINDYILPGDFPGLIKILCLLGGATSGGTDFIAVAVSEKRGVDAWNYILFGNAAMLVVAGFLFGWDKALYSILFQYASTQIVHLLNPRYKRTTLFIISDKSEEIYEQIKDATHHGATLFQGTGLWGGQPRSMIYSVIAGDQVKKITRKVRQIDPHAFINILKTDQVSGNFYQQPHD